jgi:hypothetical protein
MNILREMFYGHSPDRPKSDILSKLRKSKFWHDPRLRSLGTNRLLQPDPLHVRRERRGNPEIFDKSARKEGEGFAPQVPHDTRLIERSGPRTRVSYPGGPLLRSVESRYPEPASIRPFRGRDP